MAEDGDLLRFLAQARHPEACPCRGPRRGQHSGLSHTGQHQVSPQCRQCHPRHGHAVWARQVVGMSPQRHDKGPGARPRWGALLEPWLYRLPF